MSFAGAGTENQGFGAQLGYSPGPPQKTQLGGCGQVQEWHQQREGEGDQALEACLQNQPVWPESAGVRSGASPVSARLSIHPSTPGCSCFR